MRVKNVVKVMNFHSLLRVDKAKKEAERYFMVEKQLRTMIDCITNNRNVALDYRDLIIPANKPILNIYVGSDLGFCGSYNSTMFKSIKEDGADKILIGKKILSHGSNVVMSMTKQSYIDDSKPVTDFLNEKIIKKQYSEINVCYNNYVNVGTINWTKKRIFPFEFDHEKANEYKDDYICENDMENLIMSMIATYIDYEIQITVKNSLASENVMRQNSTNESLKKIEEIENDQIQRERKQKSIITSQKNIERFVKHKAKKVNEYV